jgi:hypothetical protein
MKLGIGLEQLIRGAVLMLLKIPDEVIEDLNEVILKTVVADDTFGPYNEARAPLGNKSNTDRGINTPRGKEGVQFIEGILELCSRVEELRLAAIQRLGDALNVPLNVPIPQGLIAVQFRKFVYIERTLCDILHLDWDTQCQQERMSCESCRGCVKGIWAVPSW